MESSDSDGDTQQDYSQPNKRRKTNLTQDVENIEFKCEGGEARVMEQTPSTSQGIRQEAEPTKPEPREDEDSNKEPDYDVDEEEDEEPDNDADENEDEEPEYEVDEEEDVDEEATESESDDDDLYDRAPLRPRVPDEEDDDDVSLRQPVEDEDEDEDDDDHVPLRPPLEWIEDEEEAEELEPDPCHDCEKEFDDIEQHHHDIHVGDQDCHFCGVHFDNRPPLYKHIKEEHADSIGLVNPIALPSSNSAMPDLNAKLDKLGCSVKEPMIKKTGYLSIYDVNGLKPYYTFEVLTPLAVAKYGPIRPKGYKVEPQLPTKQITREAYAVLGKYGHDAGHLAAAANNKWSKKAYHDTFFACNLVPMGSDFNAGIWYALEIHCRKLALCWDYVSIFSGPAYDASAKTMRCPGELDISIPSHFFKVIYLEKDGMDSMTLCYLVPHNEDYSACHHHIKSLAEVEEKAKIQFLTNIPQLIHHVI